MKKTKLPKKITNLIEKALTRETLTYIFFGVLTTIIGFGSYEFFMLFPMKAITANAISTAFAVLFAYITNKIWVFNSQSWDLKLIGKEFSKFLAGRFSTFAIESVILFVFVDNLKFDKTILKLFTMVLIVILNYFISKKAVFTSH